MTSTEVGLLMRDRRLNANKFAYSFSFSCCTQIRQFGANDLWLTANSLLTCSTNDSRRLGQWIDYEVLKFLLEHAFPARVNPEQGEIQDAYYC